ncbi:metal-responsive CopG/Arc/MetJ family transcriptional regulator [Bradyrhizobium sp. USDA 4454]
MKRRFCPESEALITSPMRPAAFTMPEVLLAAIDKAAAADDPSAPNRSSIVRRAVIQFLRRQEAA